MRLGYISVMDCIWLVRNLLCPLCDVSGRTDLRLHRDVFLFERARHVLNFNSTAQFSPHSRSQSRERKSSRRSRSPREESKPRTTRRSPSPSPERVDIFGRTVSRREQAAATAKKKVSSGCSVVCADGRVGGK